MNSIFQKHPWLRYVIGAFVILLGLLIIILGSLSPSNLQDVVNIVLSVACILLGLFFLASILLSETHKIFTITMVLSSIFLTLGVLLLVARFGIRFYIDPKLLVYLLSIFTLAFGAVALGKAVSLIFYKEKVSWIIVMFLIATVCVVLGVLSLVYADKLVQAVYIILGVALVVVGVLFIVFSIINKG